MGSKSGKFKYGYCIANGVAFEKNPSLAEIWEIIYPPPPTFRHFLRLTELYLFC